MENKNELFSEEISVSDAGLVAEDFVSSEIALPLTEEERKKRLLQEHKARKSKDFKQRLKTHLGLYPFLIPAMAFALIFAYLPMLGLVIAFKENINFARYPDPITAFMQAEWTLGHFATIFSDPEIGKYIGNTLVISFMKLFILFPMPVILAVMIAEVRNKAYSTFVQAVVFLPHFLSWVVITGIFQDLLAVEGPINNLILDPLASVWNKGPGSWASWLKMDEGYHWFGEAKTFPALVVAMSGWKEIGYSSIVYVSAIMGIDACLYEAAKLDGASKVQQMVKVTVPMIASTIIVMLIIRVGYMMDAGFDQIQTMISSTTRETGEIIGTYIYRISLGQGVGEYGLSTAVGLFNGVISLALVCTANTISKKVTQEGIW